MYKIFEKLEDLNANDIRYGTAYIRKEELAIHRYVNSITIKDIKNAFRTGKEVITYVIYANLNEDELDKFYLNGKIGETYEFVKNLFVLHNDVDEVDLDNGVKVFKRVERGIHTFSPIHLDNIKPLVVVPNKWKLNDVKKLLAHGARVECRGRYSDDYAHDAATNYGEGEVEALKLLEKITERPSGWWVNPEREAGVVGLNCHSFEYNNVYFGKAA